MTLYEVELDKKIAEVFTPALRHRKPVAPAPSIPVAVRNEAHRFA